MSMHRESVMSPTDSRFRCAPHIRVDSGGDHKILGVAELVEFSTDVTDSLM